ncbi:hypothetical protein C8A03DRAFT_15594 [Achaetomium macrosporum]|uniref:Uncharacterized protein n=1 Tax=Achaetomium macrosporum TaxID=79813 RepID=A0AAN7C9R7_9PEZI|nr:hypothetical protein C8A03DRAFT_15594 [Achaetomium macrosporum]
MVDSPNLDESAFCIPKLRRCPFDPATLSRDQRLQGGADGYVWRYVHVIEEPILTSLPVQFYDTGPPELDAYYAAQRECQNAALLQMMVAAVADANGSRENPGPVLLINAHPKTAADALANVYAFSNQGRSERKQATGVANLKLIKSLPRMRQCHGWMAIDGQVFNELPMSLRPPSQVIGKLHRSFSPDQTYTAIVYEYVEEGENDPAAVEAVTSFLWLAGFSYGNSSLIQNWKGAVLIDLSDIVHPLGFDWKITRYGPKTANMVLRQW